MSAKKFYTDIKTIFSQGQKLIQDSKDLVLFVGQTGSGKSTVINALIGNQLLVRKSFKKNLKVGKTRAIFQKINRDKKTSILDHCYDPQTRLAYQQFPNFEIRRDLIQNILDALYVKRLCQMTDRTIICLILDYQHLYSSNILYHFNHSNNLYLLDQLRQISKLFDKSIDFLEESIMVVLNRVRFGTLQDAEAYLKKLMKRLLQQKGFNLSALQTKIVGYLLQSQHSICILRYQKLESEFDATEFRNNFVETIRNKVPIKLEPNITLESNITLRDRFFLQSTDWFDIFPQNLVNKLKKLSKLLIQTIDKYVEETENTHVFDNTIFFINQAAQIMDEVIDKKKIMRKDQIERLMQSSFPIVSSNQITEKKLKKFSQLLIIQNLLSQVIQNKRLLHDHDFLSSIHSFGNALRKQKEQIQSLIQVSKNLIIAFPEFSNHDQENYSLNSILGTIGANFIPELSKIKSKKSQILILKTILLDSPQPETLYSNNKTIHFSGYFIKLSQIIPFIYSYKSIIITAAFLIYIDIDINLPGKNLALFAPFCVCENKIIDLKGKDAQNIEPKQANTGQDGKPGNFGQNGGHFVIGVCDYKILPKVNISGGSGGKGQNGGDGLNGADGIDAVIVTQSDTLVNVQGYPNCYGNYQTITDYQTNKLIIQNGTEIQKYEVIQWEAYQVLQKVAMVQQFLKSSFFGLNTYTDYRIKQEIVMFTKYRPKKVQKSIEVPNLQEQETKMTVLNTKTEFVFKDQYYKKEGTPGEKGKDSGKGGIGGQEGKHGMFFFINIRTDEISVQHPQEGLVRKNGKEGINGVPGKPGKGGVQGMSILGVFNIRTEKWESKVQLYSSERAQDGKIPQELNNYEIKECPQNSFYQFSEEINSSISLFIQKERLEGEIFLKQFQIKGLELFEDRLGKRNWFS